ncbi:MAG: hypothetical protein AB1576_01670 [Bacillota bacterium]
MSGSARAMRPKRFLSYAHHSGRFARQASQVRLRYPKIDTRLLKPGGGPSVESRLPQAGRGALAGKCLEIPGG